MMELAVFCTKHCENLRANFCFGALLFCDGHMVVTQNKIKIYSGNTVYQDYDVINN